MEPCDCPEENLVEYENEEGVMVFYCPYCGMEWTEEDEELEQ